MKKIVSLLISCVLFVSLFTACGGEKPVLKVYNAGEYIEKSLITDFEKEFNCKVVYETFDSNESMYTKLLSGEEYDVLVPSDYMIERLIKEGYLQELDWSKIPNKVNLLPEVMDRDYDKGNKYTAPYFWGTVGILYDSTVVDEADLSAGWDILMNTKYSDNIYMYDSERDSFMIALKALGYSMNTDNQEELTKAYEWLVKQNEVMKPIYVGDDVIDNMISGNKALAIVYSGDASYIMSENENMKYFTPDQGTNVWYDAMVMTKTCKNTELAHQYINFMLDNDNALKNSEAVGYSSSVKSAFDTMKTTVYNGINAYVPRTDYANDEIFVYQTPETKKFCSELWIKAKSNQ